MKNFNIAFIGGGNMARSLIAGLIADGYQAQRISVCEPDEAKRQRLSASHGVRTSDEYGEALEGAEVVVIAVKPPVVREVAAAIAPLIAGRDLLVMSIAAGIRSGSLERWLGGGIAVVRAMPNTPAMLRSGATALTANARVSADQRDRAESIMRAVGLTVWLDDEAQMDAVTALSGSGPAYFFLVMETLERGGRELGLPAETARLLTLQTAFGAAKMALESTEDSARLRAQVTSPGGTTERAVAVLQEGGIETLFLEALKAAHDRSLELAEMLGEPGRG